MTAPAPAKDPAMIAPGKILTIGENSFPVLRAVDPHSFYADPDLAVFLNADPDPEGKINADLYGFGSTALPVLMGYKPSAQQSA